MKSFFNKKNLLPCVIVIFLLIATITTCSSGGAGGGPTGTTPDTTTPGTTPGTTTPLTGTVTINGNTHVGGVLTADTGSLGGSGAISYQWKRGDTAAAAGTNISGATSSTYTLVTADASKYIKVTVTRSGNNGSITSAATSQITQAEDHTQDLTSVSGAITTNVTDGERTGIIKVDGSKLSSNFAVVQYSLTEYKNKEITISFSVDIKREGSAGNLNWQINNSNYPSVGSQNNASVGQWYNITGTWKGTPTDNNPVLYLSTYENNSNTAMFFIDNFKITITEESTSSGNFDGVTWTNADLNSGFQKTAQNGPYDVEFWSRDKQGTATMTLGVGGAYKCSWDGIYNVLFRAGRKYTGAQRKKHSEIGTFSIEYDVPTFNPGTASGSSNSYISVYGWVTGGSPHDLIEYYIVESWGEYNPKNSTGAVLKGTATIDGGTYEFYEVPNNGPTIVGDREFKQYFSIRTAKRQNGTISVTQHFNAWATYLPSISNGNLTEVSLKIESFGGTTGKAKGNAEVTKNILKINGTPIN